jgi:seryl-tRNA synthetase
VAEEKLSAGGYLPGEKGAVLLRGPAANLFRGWRDLLALRLAPWTQVTVEAPLFIDRHVLTTAKYVAHFPQHVIVGRSFRSTRSRGRFLAPAACLHFYGILEGAALAGDRESAFVVGPCARFESGRVAFPHRLAAFHMAELVVLGTARVVEAQASAVEAMLVDVFRNLGIDGSFRPATDAFFLPSSRGARLLQQLKQLKREFSSPLEDDGLALASINRHEDYFAKAFRIRLAGGESAHSFCVALGLERLTAAGLVAWGSDPKGWPRELAP